MRRLCVLRGLLDSGEKAGADSSRASGWRGCALAVLRRAPLVHP